MQEWLIAHSLYLAALVVTLAVPSVLLATEGCSARNDRPASGSSGGASGEAGFGGTVSDTGGSSARGNAGDPVPGGESKPPPRGLCQDGWCWLNPVPQGNALLAVSAVGVNDWWAVGERGTTLHVSAQGTALALAPAESHTLRAVWAAAADDVWAAGDTVVRWQGQSWTNVATPALPAKVNAIGGTGPEDVWLVGGNAGLTSAHAAHYDGADWTAVAMDDLPPVAKFPPAFELRSLYVAAVDDVWFSTDLLEAPLIHYDGHSFSWGRAPLVDTVSARILCLAGRGPLDVWAAGEGGTVLHYDGAWHDVSLGPDARKNVVSLALQGNGDVLVLDDARAMRRRHDQQWSVEPSPAIASAIAPDADGNVLGVGYGGAMVSYDGSAWHADASPFPVGRSPQASPGSIWAATENDVWVVWPSVARWNGQTWAYPSVNGIVRFDGAAATTPIFTRVWGSGPKDVYLTGAEGYAGLAMHYDGSRWTPVKLPSPDGFRVFDAVVGGTGMNDVWMVAAASDNDSIQHMTLSFHFDGTGWTRMDDVPVEVPLLIWIEPTTHLPYVAGAANGVSPPNGAAIAFREGATWRAMDFSGTYLDVIRGLLGTGPGDLWAISGGSLVHFDGNSWAAMGPDATPDLLWSLAGRAPNDLWMTRTEGGVAHYDGQAWTFSSNPFRTPAAALWQSAAGDLWALVDHGVEIYTPAH